MADSLLFAASASALLLAGALVAASLRIGSLPRFLLATYVCAWGSLVVSTVLLSIPVWLSRWSLGAAALAVLVVACVLWARLGRPLPPGPGSIRFALDDRVVRTLAVAVVVGGVYIGALALFTTPNDWDGLAYHETRAILWDQQGRVGYVQAGNEPRLNGNPPVAEIGLYLAMATARSDRFAALPQYLALWACVLAVAVIGRRIGFSATEASYGALVFATLPIVALQGAAILNDLVVASFLLGSVAFLVGRTRADLAMGALALALALGTKLNAVLTLPVVALVVLSAIPRSRWLAACAALGGGVLLASPWYVLNLIETGSPDGDLTAATGQGAERTVGAIVGTFRALLFDTVDVSGLRSTDLLLAPLVGAALVLAALVARSRGGSGGTVRALLFGGLIAASVPPVLVALEDPVRTGWERFWFKLGFEDISLAKGAAWSVQRTPDTSLSWFGVVGTIIVFSGVVLSIVAVRGGRVPRVTVVLATSPVILLAIFSVTIVYDEWRGRLTMCAFGLACAAWSSTLRYRALSVGATALCVTTLGLSLVASYTKPSGLRLLEPSGGRSVWRTDRIGALTVIRDYDGTRALLRAVDEYVPHGATLAVAAPMDAFLAPLAGDDLSRELVLVPDGSRAPARADWIVVHGHVSLTGCRASWRPRTSTKTWRVLERIGPDRCGFGRVRL